MIRTPGEVFAHHVEALRAEDLDGIIADYTDDAVWLSPDGALRGRWQISQGYVRLLAELPRADWEFKTLVAANDVLLVEWAADAGRSRVDDGIDTYVFQSGMIKAQSGRYTLLRARP